MPWRFVKRLVGILVAAAAPSVMAGCDGGSGPPPAPGTVQGASALVQSATVGTTVPVHPSVRVLSEKGKPLPGTEVRFTITGGAGTVVAPVQTTGTDGVASAGGWTLGTKAGPNTLEARVGSLPPVVFTATGQAGAPTSLSPGAPEVQDGVVGAGVEIAPAVVAKDAFQNPVPQVAVTFTVTGGGGVVVGGATQTDATGTARAGAWTLGTVPGENTLRAEMAGVDSVSFRATARAGPPGLVTATAGQGQAATVGASVSVLPTVLVTDRFGNALEGVPVSFRIGSGEGSLVGTDPATNASGMATVGGWTLGTTAGVQTLVATVSGADSAVFSATAAPAAPAALTIVGGDAQVAVVGTAVPAPPSVRVEDSYGNPVPGTAVSFLESLSPSGGGASSLADAESLTNQEGVATPGTWTLGTRTGRYELTASVAGVQPPVVFAATAVADEPAALTALRGNNQWALIGSPVAVHPTALVSDRFGNPVGGVEVAFSVAQGGGSIESLSGTSDADGTASAGRWTLGPAPGANTLVASAAGLPSVSFHATATALPPTALVKIAGDNQSASVGSPVPVPPAVRVVNGAGDPVPGVAVTFQVAGGGGSVNGGATLSDASGVAAVESWILGGTPGTNTLNASAPGLPVTQFTAQGVGGGGGGGAAFDLEIQFLTAVSGTQQAIFQAAADRWGEVITGDIPDVSTTLNVGGCQPVTDAVPIDDVRVYVSVVAIDGVGGVLGQAGPCYYRSTGQPLPITGIMRLDAADVDNMEANGILRDVILHELGHVLGIGTFWNRGVNAFLVGAGTAEPYFTGANALAAFDASGGAARLTPKVPVENTGGSGTRDSHWRESVHGRELMTGWIQSAGTGNPLSIITIGSLADLGYVVDMGAADPYTIPNPAAPMPVFGGAPVFIEELPPPDPIPLGGGSTPPKGR